MEGPVTALEKLTQSLAAALTQLKPRDAAELLSQQDDATILGVLRAVSPEVVRPVFTHFRGKQRKRLLAAASRAEAEQWARSETYAEGTIGRMMEAPTATFAPDGTVGEAVETIRDLVKHAFVTYLFVVDPAGRLVGIVTMRELLLADRSSKLADIMLTDVFFLTPELQVRDAMRLVLNRHFPVYPVCDADRTLLGEIRGQTMFEEQAFEISAQPGKMVGVDREERLSTPWKRSLLFRHPWLQLNLLTAFLAAAVVGVFQDTIDRIVILAMFLPVLAGQSGNTGCQALAVTLRGITLGELKPGKERTLVLKEGLLGLLNGALVGVSAGIGMYVVATLQKNPARLELALIVFVAMIGSCVVSGISGALIPMTLRKLGADPATASSIFLTTATDIASMGLFLGLATLFIAR
jgi:magnesium transporter